MFLLNPYRYAVASGYDSDAQAFFTATGISDTTIKTAVNQLVLDLKAASIWTKMTAIYPFVGGTSSTHSYNLKNTAAYQITWNGTVTHDANGITGNGTTGYGNTNLAPSALSLNNTHMSIYCRTAGANESVSDMGCLSSGGTNRFSLYIRYTNLFLSYMYTTAASLNVSNTNAQGFFITSRRANNDMEGYKNGSSIVTQTATNAGSLAAQNIYICGQNFNGTLSEPSARNYAFASIGAGLTDTEAADFNTAVETFQDALSRGVV